ncbi:MAG TPA: 4-hydroxyphenylpyruvate dioxygenase [Terriglobales bacterium]|nr:4-hydroxyphenylpyruvate dioxygenase [Terriglobales bacterium]
MENPLKLKRVHHVEFWVGNAKQASFFYRKTFGFSQIAYRGLETGERNLASYVLNQNKTTFLLSTPLHCDHPAAEHIKKHGDGVRDIALEVVDADFAFEAAVRHGAKPFMEPKDVTDENGTIRRAAVHTYGDTIHSLISFKDYKGPFLPGFVEDRIEERQTGILRVDHMVGNVELGKMNPWADFYSNVFGFHRYISFDDKDISTEYSALMSIVMSDDSYSVKFPINEPAPGKRKSQIDEYLQAYCGPGVQHIALQVKDVLYTVDRLQQNGLEFLRVPDAYYEVLRDRVGALEEPIEEIKRLGILVDRDQEGYLLQIFSKPVEDRPTVFYEIIQRKGSRGFGKGNFKALFEALELEQAKRGNL